MREEGKLQAITGIFPSSFCFLTVYLKINQEAPFLLPFTAHIAVYDPYLHKSKWQKVFSFLNAEAFIIVL